MGKQISKLGNQNSAKEEELKSSSFLNMRCKRRDKAGWVKQANKEGLKLAPWIVKTLNNQVK